MVHDDLRAGKIMAVLSYATFIVNGAFVRSEILAFVEGITGVTALVCLLPYWKQFPVYSKWMLLLLSASIVLVSAKAVLYPVTYTFLALVPSAIAISIYVYKYPHLFLVRPVLYSLLGAFIGLSITGLAPAVFAGSRNQISTILLSFGVLAFAIERKRTDLPIALMIFVACILAVGSSGVVTSAILVLATLFRQNQRLHVKVLVLSAVVLALVGFGIYLQYYASHEFTAKFSLDRLTSTDVRFQIISDYFARYTHGSYLWLGAPDSYSFYVWSAITSGGSWAYVDSLHNSYLSVHAKVGILCFAVYFIIARVAVALRSDLYNLLLFAVILFRSFSDTVFILDGYYNFSFYFFFVLASVACAERASTRAPSWVGPPSYAAGALPSVPAGASASYPGTMIGPKA